MNYVMAFVLRLAAVEVQSVYYHMDIYARVDGPCIGGWCPMCPLLRAADELHP